MEEWNAGILGVKAETNHFNCKKHLKTHYSITPSFQLGLPARALQWQAGRSP